MQVELRVEVAFGEDPATDPTGWTWVDVSEHVQDDEYEIVRGRDDEASEIGPSQVTVRLDNSTGRYTPRRRASPHWPHVRRGVPVRLSIRLDPGDPWDVRLLGQVASWAPAWPDGDQARPDVDLEDPDTPINDLGWSEVTITCAGVLRRLAHGRRLASPVRRSVTAGPPDWWAGNWPEVWAYWPLEDGPDTTRPASALLDGPPLTLDGKITFGADETQPGSEALAQVDKDAFAAWWGPVDAPAGHDWCVSLLCRFTGAPTDPVRLIVARSTGTVKRWRVTLSATSFRVVGVNNAGTTVFDQDNTASGFWSFDPFDGSWFVCRLEVLDAGGGDVIAGAYLSVFGDVDPTTWPPDTAPATILASNIYTGTVGRVTQAGNWEPSADAQFSFGHLIASGPGTPLTAFDGGIASGWMGEPAAARLARLSVDENVALDIDGDLSEPMGRQPVVTLLEIVQECAASDAGHLSERNDRPGLSYRTRSQAWNRPPDLTAGPDGLVDFAPVLDDQALRNDVTVERAGGGTARVTDPAHADIEGPYDDQVTLSLATDAQALQHAGWRLHRGTWPEMRYPTVTVDLAVVDNPADWLALRPGDRLRITDLPAQHPTPTVDLVAEGMTETITSGDGIVLMFNCSPGEIFDVDLIDTDGTPDTALGRLDSDASELAAPVDADDTALSVAVTAGPLWTTDGDQFPLTVEVDGETMTVTSITGASSPQTFTVTRGVPAFAHTAGTEVRTGGFRLAL